MLPKETGWREKGRASCQQPVGKEEEQEGHGGPGGRDRCVQGVDLSGGGERGPGAAGQQQGMGEARRQRGQEGGSGWRLRKPTGLS